MGDREIERGGRGRGRGRRARRKGENHGSLSLDVSQIFTSRFTEMVVISDSDSAPNERDKGGS